MDEFVAVYDLASIYHRQRRYPIAERFVKRALTWTLDEFGKQHPNTVKASHLLGIIYADQKQLKEALEVLMDAKAVAISVHGNDTMEHAGVVDSISDVYFKGKKHEIAEGYLLESLEIKKNIFGTRLHPEV